MPASPRENDRNNPCLYDERRYRVVVVPEIMNRYATKDRHRAIWMSAPPIGYNGRRLRLAQGSRGTRRLSSEG